MQRILTATLLLSMAATCARGQCLSPDDGGGGGGGSATESDVSALRTARLDFALALLREATAAGAPLVSPHSAFDALLLAFFGSANATEDALRTALRLPAGFGKMTALRAHRADALLRAAEEAAADAEAGLTPPPSPSDDGLRSASRVFAARETPLKPCVEELLRDDLERVDVAGDPEAATARVNAWVAERTAGRIRDLLPTLSRDAQLVLANAAFFKGAWESGFAKDRTALEVFHVSRERYALVHMMKQKGTFNYVASERLGAHLLELPFLRGGFSLLVLLPPFARARSAGAGAPLESGVDALLRRLDAAALNELLRDADGAGQSVEVEVPRLAQEAEIDLVPVLERLGVGDAFRPAGDYSGFSGARGPTFDGARQRVRLEADEDGATAAAATALFLFRSARPVEPVRFVANHPFVYLLVRRQSAPAAAPAPAAELLFAGVYRGPTAPAARG